MSAVLVAFVLGVVFTLGCVAISAAVAWLLTRYDKPTIMMEPTASERAALAQLAHRSIPNHYDPSDWEW